MIEAVDDEQTVDRGLKSPRPSSRRIAPTLMRIFQRRREAIGLSVAQAAKLAGLDPNDLARFEATGGQHLLYEHAVILARVLGVSPDEMPGLRPRSKHNDLEVQVADLVKSLLAGPILIFEGTSGERYGGDIDRVVTTPSFALKIGDSSLREIFPKGTLLGFVSDLRPQSGDVTLLRHRRSKLLALRRFTPPSFSGLVPWQPAYVAAGSEWLAVGRLQLVVPRVD